MNSNVCVIAKRIFYKIGNSKRIPYEIAKVILNEIAEKFVKEFFYENFKKTTGKNSRRNNRKNYLKKGQKFKE